VTDDEISRMNARIGAYASRSDGTENLGIDWFEHLQKPDLPKTSDPLARFVISRIIELETEPRGEIKAAYDEPAGPMAHRYAKHVRRDCIVFRQIVLAYLQAHDRAETCEEDHDDSAELSGVMIGLRQAVLAVANRWSDHREFDPGWRLT
jgi:hypothetical protein